MGASLLALAKSINFIYFSISLKMPRKRVTWRKMVPQSQQVQWKISLWFENIVLEWPNGR